MFMDLCLFLGDQTVKKKVKNEIQAVARPPLLNEFN